MLRDTLARGDDVVVGDDQPYPIEEEIDYTTPAHTDAHGVPGVMIEIRQDATATAAGAAAWASRLARAYRLIEASAPKGDPGTEPGHPHG